jgi:hypothetical protein
MEGSPRLRTGKFTHLNSNFDLFFLKKKNLKHHFFQTAKSDGVVEPEDLSTTRPPSTPGDHPIPISRRISTKAFIRYEEPS